MLLALALLVWRVRLPDIGGETRRAARAERATHSLRRHRNLVLGIPAIMLYMICEIGIGSTLVNFISRPDIGGMTHERAADYVMLYWGGATTGRFVGSWLLRCASPGRLLAAVSIGALALAGTAILPAALGVSSLHSVLRGPGLPPDDRFARRAARELTGPSPVVSSRARCTSSAIAARAAGASREATASYTRS